MRIRLVSSIVALLIVSGCGTSASQPASTGGAGATQDGPLQLSFAIFGGGGPHLDWMLSETKSYDDAVDGVTVDYTQDNFYAKPVDPYDKLQQRYFEDDPDLVAGFIGGSLRPDAEAGRFLDLSDLWSQLGLEHAVPASIADLASVDGHRYWVPTLAQWNPVFYNTQAFAAAGVEPPQDWDALLQVCADLRAAGIERPISQAGEPSWTPPAARWFSTINLALNGPDIHEQLAQGRVAWTDERVRAVFAEWNQLIDAGCFGDPILQSYSDAIAKLADGRAPMQNLGEWIYESAFLHDDDPIDFFSLPPIAAGLPRTQIALVYGLAIPADAAHPEEAKALLQQLVSQQALTRAYQTVPRVIPDSRVDPGYLPRHQRGLELFQQADRLVELWEFSAPREQGDIGLDLFTSFLADRSGLEGYLEEAERARIAAYGPADGG
jgi:multiple sugar transport system substrate-binding protein